MNKQYRYIFFDLDHTLWDYETNSVNTLREMFVHFNLQQFGQFVFQNFHDAFSHVNRQLWHLYDHGKIDSAEIRRSRFELVLSKLGVVNPRLARDLSVYYLSECPQKTALIPGTTETLQYLQHKYPLTVITNGFNEVQLTKLTSSGLLKFFNHVVTSEEAGSKKPAPGIFHYALSKNSAAPEQALMVGDNPLTDIAGAKAAQIDAVLFNPQRLQHNSSAIQQIHHLGELRNYL